MARLPQPGSDSGAWGDILNDFLTQAHNSDGTLKDIPQSKVTNLTADLATKAATTTTVNGHPLSANVTVTKSDVGLGNVDNTADSAKSFTATQISDSTATGRSVLTAADATTARGAIGAAQNTGGIDGYLHNFTSSNFLKWSKALTNLRNDDSDVKILCVGDSNTRGYGSSTTATVASARGWPAQLERLIRTAGWAPAIEGGVAPQQVTNASLYDNRYTGAAEWFSGTNVEGFGWGTTLFNSVKGFFNIASSGKAMTFAPGFECDRFDVYHFPFIGSGTFSIQATGGSATNVATGGVAVGSAVIVKTTVSAASVSASNSVVLTTTNASPINVFFIEPWNSTKKQLRISNVGMAGSQARYWAATGIYAGGSPKKCIEAYQPDLTIIDLGTNDLPNGRTPAQVVTDIQSVITSAQITGDVVLKTPLPSGASYAPFEDEKAAFVQLVLGLGYPVVDSNSRIGPFAAYDAAGYMYSDDLHGNDYAYGAMASWMFEALRKV